MSPMGLAVLLVVTCSIIMQFGASAAPAATSQDSKRCGEAIVKSIMEACPKDIAFKGVSDDLTPSNKISEECCRRPCSLEYLKKRFCNRGDAYKDKTISSVFF